MQLGLTAEKLREIGVQTLGVVASGLERARLYFRFHPMRLPLAADPELTTHRSYGVPRLETYPSSARINPTGELPAPLPVPEARDALDRLDRFEPTETDREDRQRVSVVAPQLGGHFLVDREGIVRWVNIEGANEGIAGIGKFPTAEEMLAAARALPM